MSNDQTRVVPGATLTGAAPDRTLVSPGGPNATLYAGSPAADPGRTQLSITITCPVCKAVTPNTEVYCSDCGFLLSSEGASGILVPPEETVPAELVEAVTGRRFRL